MIVGLVVLASLAVVFPAPTQEATDEPSSAIPAMTTNLAAPNSPITAWEPARDALNMGSIDATGQGVSIAIVDDFRPYFEQAPSLGSHGSWVVASARLVAPDAQILRVSMPSFDPIHGSQPCELSFFSVVVDGLLQGKAGHRISSERLNYSIACAIQAAVERDPDVLSLSFGLVTSDGSPLLAEKGCSEERLATLSPGAEHVVTAIREATHAGIVVVAAAGNEGHDALLAAPACLDEVEAASVMAVDANGDGLETGADYAFSEDAEILRAEALYSNEPAAWLLPCLSM